MATAAARMGLLSYKYAVRDFQRGGKDRNADRHARGFSAGR